MVFLKNIEGQVVESMLTILTWAEKHVKISIIIMSPSNVEKYETEAFFGVMVMMLYEQDASNSL